MDVTKAADQATNALSTIVMIAQQAGDDEIAKAAENMIRAIGEIQQRLGASAEAQQAPPAGPPAMSGNPSMAAAAADATAMMNQPTTPPM
jgi:hypothetical protein